MKKIISEALKIRSEKVLISNFLSLTSVQLANYILPLITLPYLIRVLGVEKFGLISFAQAFMHYFVIITDYGFGLSATRDIAIYRDHREKLVEIFNSVFWAKIILMILSFIILIILLYSFKKFSAEILFYLIFFLVVIGNTLFPTWFFQGIEKMSLIALLNFISKVFYTASVFIFIKMENHYIYIPLLQGLASIFIGIISLSFIYMKFKIRLQSCSFSSLKEQFKNGWYIFLSEVSIGFYDSIRIFIVGLLTNNLITGYYSIAEKLSSIIRLFPIQPLLKATYPRLSKIYSENKQKALQTMYLLQRWTSLYSIVTCTIAFIFAPYIVQIIAGNIYHETILAFRILLIAIIFENANTFRVKFLLISKREDIFLKIHFFIGLAGSSVTIIFTYLFSYIGTAIAASAIELLVLVATINYFRKGLKNYVVNFLS